MAEPWQVGLTEAAASANIPEMWDTGNIDMRLAIAKQAGLPSNIITTPWTRFRRPEREALEKAMRDMGFAPAAYPDLANAEGTSGNPGNPTPFEYTRRGKAHEFGKTVVGDHRVPHEMMEEATGVEAEELSRETFTPEVMEYGLTEKQDRRFPANPGDPTVAANLQLLRKDAEGELAAISQYERHILNLQDDQPAKQTLEHIEAEEKTHLAELSRLIAQRDPTQGAELEAKLKAIESHLDAIAASTLDMPLPELPGESVRDWLPSVTGSPGIIVDPGVARATPCIEIDLGKGRKPLTFSKGIVGALDQDQRSLYCQEGMETRPATEKQQKRLAAMEAAAKLCSQEATGTTTEEHLKNYYRCLGRELRKNGVEPW